MSDRWAIVTGAGSGIGRESAIALAESGWCVVLAGRRTALLEEGAEACRSAGSPIATPLTCDVRSPSDCEALGESVPNDATLALVNAAGVSHFAPLSEMGVDQIRAQIETNLLGTILATRALIPKMLAVGQGDVVNVLSIAATTPLPNSEVYAASKAGLLAFGRSLSLTVRKHGVRVVAILPGATDTPLWDGSDWTPPAGDMLSARAVGEAVRDVIDLPRDRTIDELVLTPPKGIL